MTIHPVAIFLGTITDLILSFVASAVLFSMLHISATNPHVYEWSLALGLVADAIGGFVTARKSDTSKSFNAIIFGVIQVLICVGGAAFIAMPLWFNIASVALVTPAAVLGAYFAMD